MDDHRALLKQLAALDTERVNPDTLNIDQLSAVEIIETINHEDQKVASAVLLLKDKIALAAETFTRTIKNGNRVFYIGAGTSGRLGVLDAAECPPTFGTEPDQIIGVIAGGYEALVLSKEGVEDNRQAAVDDLTSKNIQPDDFLIGLAASTRTPYTLAGLGYARSIGCTTAFVCCNPVEEKSVIEVVDFLIPIIVGAEVLTGSTRMKSGTAQKMVLNMISTTAMILMGKTYGNLMVDLQVRSKKLAARSRKILIELLSIPYEEASQLIEKSGGAVKTAIVMKRFGCDKGEAESKLQKAAGFINRIKK